MLNLTAQQIKVFDVIKDSLKNNGYPPTRVEIAKILGFKSVNAAESHIKALVKKTKSTFLVEISMILMRTMTTMKLRLAFSKTIPPKPVCWRL